MVTVIIISIIYLMAANLMKVILIVYQMVNAFHMIFIMVMKLLFKYLTMMNITLPFVYLLTTKQQKIIVTRLTYSGLINKHICLHYQLMAILILMLLRIYQMLQLNKIVCFIIIYKELMLIMKLKKIKLSIVFLMILFALVQTLLILLNLSH